VPPQRTPRRSKRPVRFPNRIRHYRLQGGLTQRALAHAVGRLRWTVSAWEHGATLPTAPDLFKLAKALNTFVEALYPCLYEAARRPLEERSAA
jgi:transcriptional regulator with XRE-family HTH domain